VKEEFNTEDGYSNLPKLRLIFLEALQPTKAGATASVARIVEHCRNQLLYENREFMVCQRNCLGDLLDCDTIAVSMLTYKRSSAVSSARKEQNITKKDEAIASRKLLLRNSGVYPVETIILFSSTALLADSRLGIQLDLPSRCWLCAVCESLHVGLKLLLLTIRQYSVV